MRPYSHHVRETTSKNNSTIPILDATITSGFQVTQQKKYNSLKYQVQDLIKLEKLKFEESNGPAEVEDLFEAKAEMIK